jgi:hypothetical protein
MRVDRGERGDAERRWRRAADLARQAWRPIVGGEDAAWFGAIGCTAPLTAGLYPTPLQVVLTPDGISRLKGCSDAGPGTRRTSCTSSRGTSASSADSGMAGRWSQPGARTSGETYVSASRESTRRRDSTCQGCLACRASPEGCRWLAEGTWPPGRSRRHSSCMCTAPASTVGASTRWKTGAAMRVVSCPTTLADAGSSASHTISHVGRLGP